jgi:cytoplasmic iron level regulating protein YaaA (DUF328/UPF0246 family)
MRPAAEGATDGLTQPVLSDQARVLHQYLQTLTTTEIQSFMKVSEKLAEITKGLISQWSEESQQLRPAIDSFLGDIYSGLQVASLDAEDRAYAQSHLRILSGLYGILRPLDGIYPYRFEMGYRVPDPRFANLYSYWGTAIVDTLPENETIIDLSAVEYGKTVTKYAKLSSKSMHMVTPRFLTVSPKTGEPTFVVVHAKIARGAFAHWMIRNRIEDEARLKEFDEIGYRYDAVSSTPEVPVFICREFQGLGLSVRLT